MKRRGPPTEENTVILFKGKPWPYFTEEEMQAKKQAKELLDEVAAEPSMDELFHRAPPLSQAEIRAMRAKLREERASWGGGNG